MQFNSKALDDYQTKSEIADTFYFPPWRGRMQGSVLQLLQQRDLYDAAIWNKVLPLWQALQREIGVPEDLRAETPIRLELEGERIAFEVLTRVPATTVEKERSASRRVTLPLTVFDGSVEDLEEVLRREFPLACTRCGIFHSAGTRRCDSAAKCWGWVRWRPEAPRPRFYVETAGNYGYYFPGPRGLRYVIDLKDYTIFGIQITLRRSEKWINPIPEVVANIVRRIGEGVGSDLADIISRMDTHADPSCLAYDPPSWCTEDEPRVRVNVQPSRLRLLTA